MNFAQATVALIAMGVIGLIALAATLAAIRWHAAALAAQAQVTSWQDAVDAHIMWLTERSDVTLVLQNVQAQAHRDHLAAKATDVGPWRPKILRDVLRMRETSPAMPNGAKRIVIRTKPRQPSDIPSAPMEFDRTHPAVFRTA